MDIGRIELVDRAHYMLARHAVKRRLPSPTMRTSSLNGWQRRHASKMQPRD